MVIRNPVRYNADDQAIVDAFVALDKDMKGAYWSRDEISALRTKIKSHYIIEQAHTCCYCDRHLGTENHRMWDIEHIAARSDYPWFMFEPLNLAASCVDCNRSKSEKDPITNKEALNRAGRKTYPHRSDDFRILHPHFDEYDEHIYHHSWVYVGKTPKGKNTIYACDLLRYAEKFISWSNKLSDTTFEKDVDLVFGEEGTISEDAVDRIVSSLD